MASKRIKLNSSSSASSQIVVEEYTHSHVWKVRAFLDHFQCSDQDITSELFVVDSPKPGSDDGSRSYWKLSITPSSRYIGVALKCSDTKDGAVTAKVTFLIPSANPNKPDLEYRYYAGRYKWICTSTYIHGARAFMRSVIEENLDAYVPNGELSLKVLICFRPVSRTVAIGAPEVLSLPSCLLKENYANMFLNSKFSDFEIKCSDRSFPVHRNVLVARSEYFAAMLSTELSTESTNRIARVEEDAEVMEQLLLYLYSGTAPKVPEMIMDLFVAANKYGVAGLRILCSTYLLKSLTVDNVCDILMIMDSVVQDREAVHYGAMGFFLENYPIIMESDGWRNLGEKKPDLEKELLRSIVKMVGNSKKRKQTDG